MFFFVQSCVSSNRCSLSRISDSCAWRISILIFSNMEFRSSVSKYVIFVLNALTQNVDDYPKLSLVPKFYSLRGSNLMLHMLILQILPLYNYFFMLNDVHLSFDCWPGKEVMILRISFFLIAPYDKQKVPWTYSVFRFHTEISTPR